MDRQALHKARDDGAVSDDGVYWMDGTSTDGPFEAYCDMTTEGGGWTVVARGIGGDTSGWLEATGSLNSGSVGVLSDTFKLADDQINAVDGEVYRFRGTGSIQKS